MPPSPRVVIGAPLFGKAAYLPATLDSLLAQTFEDFAVVLVDDRSEDDTVEIARRYAARDPRIHVEVNAERLGMLENTRKALRRSRERYPRAEFWALGSDHDVWAPRFLEVLVGLLDADPDAVLANCASDRIDERGRPYAGSKGPRALDTTQTSDRRLRMAETYHGMVAGSMIYSLIRASALDGLGHYRPVLVPDRLLLCELALRGTFAGTKEVLWSRRFRGLATLARQRRAFFLHREPWYVGLPWWWQHVGAMAWVYAVRAEGAPLGIDRRAGAALALDYLKLSARHRLFRRKLRLRFRARRMKPMRIARLVRRRVVAFVVVEHGEAIGAAARRGLARLQGFGPTRRLAEDTLAPRFERVASRVGGHERQAGRARELTEA